MSYSPLLPTDFGPLVTRLLLCVVPWMSDRDDVVRRTLHSGNDDDGVTMYSLLVIPEVPASYSGQISAKLEGQSLLTNMIIYNL